MPHAFGQVNWYVTLLESMKVSWDDEGLRRLLSPMAQELVSVVAHADGLDADDSRLDDATALLEDLLGMSFAACQTTLNILVRQITDLDGYATKQGVDVFPAIPRPRLEPRGLFQRMTAKLRALAGIAPEPLPRERRQLLSEGIKRPGLEHRTG